jgi:hypothetical protein
VIGEIRDFTHNAVSDPTTLEVYWTGFLADVLTSAPVGRWDRIGGTIGRHQGGREMTVQLLVEAVIIVVVIYVAIRFFRKSG